ncbi:cyclic lactone autoinducer peptide [Cohnella sp. 56]
MRKLANLLATGLALSAVVFVSTASLFYINQPKVPRELLK